ncbi:hypothetical protein IMCC3135_00975 [Granulosicoccus antarcticus IMCC3135]|uniref:Uncharacterized protein n=1 Tax=Granulosicoccus antarcticus IMCC3135 TaxID=1192854 RepID=A0A2Z2NN66_9GAMM|nr:hypothetical protein IMCC3135_00975 [Granulosicoccus antarcticus IMCC3135]
MGVNCTTEAEQCLNDAGYSESSSARLFQCARCYAQTMICRCCDRGNRYCSNCTIPAHKEARQRAAKRYQQSLQGRSKHADRQRRYRARQRVLAVKVTHQGSSETIDVVAVAKKPLATPLRQKRTEHYSNFTIVCDYCEGICSQFLRSDFLSLTDRSRQH